MHDASPQTLKFHIFQYIIWHSFLNEIIHPSPNFGSNLKIYPFPNSYFEPERINFSITPPPQGARGEGGGTIISSYLQSSGVVQISQDRLPINGRLFIVRLWGGGLMKNSCVIWGICHCYWRWFIKNSYGLILKMGSLLTRNVYQQFIDSLILIIEWWICKFTFIIPDELTIGVCKEGNKF